jgi:hypothetical protein
MLRIDALGPWSLDLACTSSSLPGQPQLISQQFFLGSLQKSFRRNIFRTLAQMKK